MKGNIALRPGSTAQWGTGSCVSQGVWKSSGVQMEELSETPSDE